MSKLSATRHGPSQDLLGPGHFSFTAVACAVLGLGLFWNLGLAPSYLEEPRRAIVAMEMAFRGDWIVPTQLGLPYVNKPPFFNWLLMGLSSMTGGYPEILGRCLSAVSLMGMGVLTYLFARRETGRDAAAAAAFLLVTSADLFFYFSTTGEIDLFYSLVHWIGFVALYLGDRPGASNAHRWALVYLTPWLCAAIGVLTKGFPSPLFLGFTYLAWFGFRRRWRALFHPGMFAGGALFVAIVGGYFMAYSARADLPFYLEGLFGQSSQRTVAEHGILDLLRHLIAFPLDTLENLLPVSLLLPLIWLGWRHSGAAARRLWLFCGVVLLANVWVYWISPGTRARYVYMLYPLLVVPLVAAWYARPSGEAPRWARLWQAFLDRLADGLSILLPLALLGMIALPGYLAKNPIEDTVAPPHFPPVWLWFGLAIGSAAWFYFLRRRYDWPARIIALVLIARLVFDGAVLPLRAVSGEAAQLQVEALALADESSEHPLRLHEYRNAGNFPLSVAYVLERERREVLSCDPNPQPGVWYLAEPASFPEADYVAGRSFAWKGRTFVLYRPLADSLAEPD